MSVRLKGLLSTLHGSTVCVRLHFCEYYATIMAPQSADSACYYVRLE